MDVTNMRTGATAHVGPRRQTPTGDALDVQIGPGDPISNIPVVMDFEHHQVHEGETHRAQSTQGTLGTTTVKFSVTVPANTYPHMVIACDVYNGAAKVLLYAEATATGGTAVTAYNRDRNSLNAAATTIKSGVTSTDGALLETFYVAAGIKTSSSGRSASEWILKAGATYRVDVVGRSANTEAVIGFNWYEV